MSKLINKESCKLKKLKIFSIIALCAVVMLSGCATEDVVLEEQDIVEASVAEEVIPTLSPAPIDETNPDSWNIDWEIIQNGAPVEEYKRDGEINFKTPDKYSSVEKQRY